MNRTISLKGILTADSLCRRDDGLKDLFLKLKAKIRVATNRFRRLPSGKKLALILGKIVKILGEMVAGKYGVHAVFAASKVRSLYLEAKRTAEVELEMPDGKGGFQRPVTVSSPSSKSYYSMLIAEPQFCKALLKTIGGLIMAISGYVAEHYAAS